MTKKIRVLQVVGTMNRGGAEIMLMDILRNLSDKTKLSFLVNYKNQQGVIEGDFDTEIKSLGSQIKHIPTQWDIGPLKYIKLFKKIYNDLGKPEIVHIHMNTKSGIIALAAKIAGAKKIIVHSHGDLKFHGNFFKRFILKTELNFQKFLIDNIATDFWSCSVLAESSLFYKKRISSNKTIIINNAIDVNSFINVKKKDTLSLKKKLDISPEMIVIGAVGRIVKRKNVDFIIDVLKEINNDIENFIFINVGTIVDHDYYKLVNNKIEKFNITNKVINFGETNNVPLLMSTFDVFISPAKNEAFGMVAIEAQASGLPCLLSSDFPKSVDMNLNLVTFVDDFHPVNWANKFKKIKNMKLLDKKKIKNNFMKLSFDIEANVHNIEKLYHE